MKHIKTIYHLRRYATLNNAAVAVAALIALSWLWGTVTTLQKNFSLQQEVDSLDQDVQIAELQNDSLRFQQQYLRSDEYLELAAREKLGKAAPGEKVIILPETPEIDDVSPSSATPVTEPSNFQQWMRFFFGRQPS